MVVVVVVVVVSHLILGLGILAPNCLSTGMLARFCRCLDAQPADQSANQPKVPVSLLLASASTSPTSSPRPEALVIRLAASASLAELEAVADGLEWRHLADSATKASFILRLFLSLFPLLFL